MISRTVLAIVVASVALWIAIAWAHMTPLPPPDAESVAGSITSYAMERYSEAAIFAAIMLFAARRYAHGRNPLLSILLGGVLALALVFLATIPLAISHAGDDASAQSVGNFVAYIAILAASLHSLNVLQLKSASAPKDI